MADETRQHPPSERKLARLWRAGSTPASPGPAGAAVIAAGWLLAVAGGPALLRWLSAGVESCLRAAAQPETALTQARMLAVSGGVVAAGVGAIFLAVALIVLIAQSGPRGDGPPPMPASGREGVPRAEAWRGGRAVLLGCLAAIVVACAVRGALMRAEDVLEAQRPLEGLAEVARAIGWPLVVALTGVAVMDAVAERAAWLHGAWMTRREVEEEMRESEGHPLVRGRRSPAARRRADA